VDGSPPAGTGNQTCEVPPDGRAKDSSRPSRVVGDGTPASCTSQAVVAAIAQGGVVTFACGPDPITITLQDTARIYNDKPDLVLDGGGKVTLSGGGARRILYQNTCDPALVWTTSSCDTQDSPKTTLQNITFADGNARGQYYGQFDRYVYGGGGVFVRGGRLSVVNSRFFRNQCEDTGPDLGGAGLRLFQMSKASPVYISNSTFGGGEGYGNQCSNGGGFSALEASVTVTNTLFSHNVANGVGRNPASAGTPGGGSGGAIYNDGDTYTLSMCGSVMRDNRARELGGAVFMVSNNRAGGVRLDRTTITNNPDVGIHEPVSMPGVFILAAPGQPVVTKP
jgi:hypothetical protein